MKESTQTLWFLAAAVGTVVLAFASRPSDATYEVSQLIGKPLNRPFESDEAKSLKIIRFDEGTATLREFEVAEQNGVWSIPSQGGYPADAERQMGQATAGVMDREILRVVSQSAADHEKYGVIAPSENLEVGQTGIGVHVTLAKEDGSALVDLIIGKEVKDAEGQHYVRRASQDVVFVIEIDSETLSTDFADWIEGDLLGLNAMDIATVRIQDYTAELVPQGMQVGIHWDRRSDLTLRYDEKDSTWVTEKLLRFSPEAAGFEAFELAEGEGLNDESLDALKSALDDLLIVDVEKKPAGLSADLSAGDNFLKDTVSQLSLMQRGFAPAPMANGKTEILSSEGEVTATLRSGVEYVLRFGNLQSDLAGGAEQAEDAPESVNRYLFVMARFNEEVLEKPELEELPELPSEGEATEEETTEAEDAGEGASEEEAEETDETDKPEAAKDREALIAARERAELHNARLTDEYESKIAEARQRVEELNARFGDWYYVIADATYKKIRLGRDDVIKAAEEEPEEPADDPNAPGAPLTGLPDLSGALGDE